MSHCQLSTQLNGSCKCHNNPLPLPTVCKYEKITRKFCLMYYTCNVITGPAAVSCSMSSLLRRNVSAISRRKSSCASLSSWPATVWSPASRSVSSWEHRKEHIRCRATVFLSPFSPLLHLYQGIEGTWWSELQKKKVTEMSSLITWT